MLNYPILAFGTENSHESKILCLENYLNILTGQTTLPRNAPYN